MKRRKKIKKKKSNKVKNPSIFSKLWSPFKKKDRSIASVQTDDGFINIEGPRDKAQLFNILEQSFAEDPENLKITFTPKGSNKTYNLNRTESAKRKRGRRPGFYPGNNFEIPED